MIPYIRVEFTTVLTKHCNVNIVVIYLTHARIICDKKISYVTSTEYCIYLAYAFS